MSSRRNASRAEPSAKSWSRSTEAPPKLNPRARRSAHTLAFGPRPNAKRSPTGARYRPSMRLDTPAAAPRPHHRAAAFVAGTSASWAEDSATAVDDRWERELGTARRLAP